MTVSLVAVAVFVRVLLQPVFGGDHAYTAFYPAVILAAYLAGRRAGLFATALSAGLAYWVFVEPTLRIKVSAPAFAPLIFFAANASVAVFLISGLNNALRMIVREQRRAEATARQNADLFRELNARVTHHLQLVSGVLALQAENEPKENISHALAKASETSLILARVHREISGGRIEPVDFLPFAHHLVSVMLTNGGLSPHAVQITGKDVFLSTDEATSLGVALLECLTMLLRRPKAGQVTLHFSCVDDEVALQVAELDPPNGQQIARLAEGYLLRAAIEQLGANLLIAVDESGGKLEIHFPRASAAAPPREAEGATLH